MHYRPFSSVVIFASGFWSSMGFAKEEQHITICSSFNGGSHPVYFTLIYASVFYRSRQVLWSSVCRMANLLNHFWVLIGDFNVILQSHEILVLFCVRFLLLNFRLWWMIVACCKQILRACFLTWARHNLRSFSASRLEVLFVTVQGWIFGILLVVCLCLVSIQFKIHFV